MNPLDAVKIALRALRGNKLRTGLTMLGIIIGVAAVIAMVSLGQGAAAQIRNTFSSMGTNLITVERGRGRLQGGGAAAGAAPAQNLTPADAEAVAKRCQDTVALVAQVCDGSVQVKLGSGIATTRGTGATPEYEIVAKYPVEEGRFITPQDETARARVAVIGRTTVENLTGDRQADVLGQDLLINRARFIIVGILKTKGSAGGFMDQDDIVIIPCATAMRRVFNRNSLSNLAVMCRTEKDMDLAMEQIVSLMRQRHKRHPPYPDNDDVNVRSQAQILEASAQSSGIMTSLLGGIALVSLLVGGIGVMNIMLVSVTERTREIGIRKAVGATSHDVMTQFLIEAVVISLLGGIIGIMLGATLALLGGKLLSLPTLVQPATVLLAVGVSGAIGIFFGIYPARKAARLNPIDALRFE